MTICRIVARPAFEIAGYKTWISGPDSAQFGHFWEQCKADGLFLRFQQLTALKPGPQTGGTTLGVSRVEADPSNRAFHYMIAVEVATSTDTGDLDRYTVPACTWAIFECRGSLPDALVASEIYAFTEWLPNSGYVHAPAPEMEVYPPISQKEMVCEFWLPIQPRSY